MGACAASLGSVGSQPARHGQGRPGPVGRFPALLRNGPIRGGSRREAEDAVDLGGRNREGVCVCENKCLVYISANLFLLAEALLPTVLQYKKAVRRALGAGVAVTRSPPTPVSGANSKIKNSSDFNILLKGYSV